MKEQFMTENLKIWICKEIISKKKTKREIMSFYHISAATIKRILD